MAAVLAGASPVRVGDLGDDLAAFLDAVEHDANVEVLVESAFDADLDVVEVDENRDVEAFLMRQSVSLAKMPRMRIQTSERQQPELFQPSLSQRSGRAASGDVHGHCTSGAQGRGRSRG